MENLDLSSLTDEQLKELPRKVNAELISRKIVKSAKLGAGSYAVGKDKDIPAGDYKIKVMASSVIIDVTDNQGEETESLYIKKEEKESGRLALHDGDELRVDELCVISVWAGLEWE